MREKFKADATMQPSIVQENGRTFVQLAGVDNVVRIPAETFHSLHDKLLRHEREMGRDVRYNPDRVKDRTLER